MQTAATSVVSAAVIGGNNFIAGEKYYFTVGGFF